LRTPFPLFARLLLWFFGNLLVLIVGLLLMVRVQFGSLDNWLLPVSSQNEIQAMTVDLVGNLAHSDRRDWGGELAGLGLAYKMDFALFDARGHWLAGADLKPPEQVRHALLFASGSRRPQDGPVEDPPPRPEAPPEFDPQSGDWPPPQGGFPGGDRPPPPLPGAEGQPRGGPRIPDFPKSVLRSEAPADYWLLVRLPPEALAMDGPVTLVGMTPALGLSPLLFDPKPWILVAAGIILFSVLFWIPLARNLTKSITRMTRATESIAEGRFDIQLADSRRDELGRLSHAINRMAGRLKDYVTGQKRFLGDAAHELCSPLARMEIALEILERRSDEQALPFVRDVRDEVTHMRKLAHELLSFSKASLGAGHVPLEPVNVAAMVAAALRLEKCEAGSIRLAIPDDLNVLGHFELLQRALANLIRNALRYAGNAGPMTISASREEEHVVIIVADDGPGVASGEVGRLFDPFYRVDAARTSETGGAGLGLAIVKSCIEVCGGVVSAANRSPQGLEIRIRLLPAGGVG